MHLNFRQC